MNNNMNEQNNQGMNNTFSTNGSGTFFNNVSQPTNQPYMNNNINQPTNQSFTNNNINQPVNPPYNQTFTNNNFDNNNNLNQNNYNNINTSNYVPNNNGKNNNKTKKIIMISAIVLGIVVVLLVLTSLLSKSPKTSIPSAPNAQKTLTCTAKHAALGIYYDEIYKYYIDDEKMTVYVTEKIDLKKTKVEGDVDGWAEDRINNIKEECNSTEGCEFKHDYSKGNYLETTLILSGNLINEQVKGLTADEIYANQKNRHESSNLTCSGNEIVPTNNEK